ncbi:MAG: aryl-sulfate sulfotransferase [Phascolarctobacterium sp.]
MKIVEKPHYVEEQYIAEQAFLERLREGNYSFEEPLVILDLYDMSPLTAMVGFKLDKPQTVTVTVLGKTPEANISHNFPAADMQVLPVYGLYPDYDNIVVLTLEDGSRTELQIQTKPLPEGPIKPHVEVTVGKENFDGCVMLLTIAQDNRPFAYDCNGDCRWYLNDIFNFDAKRLVNGHLLIGSCRKQFLYYSNGVMEVNMAGKIFHEYEIPGLYHHDQWELPNGNLLICSEDQDFTTIEDTVVEVDRKTGAVVNEWDLKDYLPAYPVGASGTADAKDWAHINAVSYLPATDCLYISCRHIDAVVCLGYTDKQLKWILGDPEGWPEDLVAKYFFTPVGDDFEWQYEQHAAMVCPDGDILLFDNHQWGSKDKEKYLAPEDSYSRGVKYHLDVDKMTISQVFQFGKERKDMFYSPYISGVEYLGPEHFLIHSGGICHVNGKVLRGLGSRLRRTHGAAAVLDSATVEVKNGQLVLEMHTPINTYRVEKLPLYAPGEVFEPGKGSILGSLGVSICAAPVACTPAGTAVLAEWEPLCTIEPEYFKITVTLPVHIEAYVVLTQGEEKRFYKILTQPNFGSTVKTSPFNTYIYKQGLSGEYAVSLVVAGEEYATDATLKL